MFVYHCPTCGQELTIPRWLPRTVTCKDCYTEIVVPYDQDPDYENCNGLAKAKVRLNNFETAHPKLTKSLQIAGGVAVAVAMGAVCLSMKDKDMDALSPAESSDQLSEEQNHPLSIDSNTDSDDSLSAESLLESEESAPTHREYLPRNPDNYDTIIKSLGIIMVHLHDGWHPSQKKIDEYKNQTGEDLPDDMTFRSPHDQPYQVKKT